MRDAVAHERCDDLLRLVWRHHLVVESLRDQRRGADVVGVRER
jgi:hypothetical protein